MWVEGRVGFLLEVSGSHNPKILMFMTSQSTNPNETFHLVACNAWHLCDFMATVHNTCWQVCQVRLRMRSSLHREWGGTWKRFLILKWVFVLEQCPDPGSKIPFANSSWISWLNLSFLCWSCCIVRISWRVSGSKRISGGAPHSTYSRIDDIFSSFLGLQSKKWSWESL